MALNTVAAAYNQNSQVKHLERSFSFCGKICMTRGIKNSKPGIAVVQYCLF